MLDAYEILAGIRALAREKKKTRQLFWIVCGLITFLLILLAAQTGLMFKVMCVKMLVKLLRDLHKGCNISALFWLHCPFIYSIVLR